MSKGDQDEEDGGGVRRKRGDRALDKVVKHEGSAGLDAVLDEHH